MVKIDIYERAVTIGKYILEKDATVRQAASYFNISKSTVHKGITKHLKEVSPRLHGQVSDVMEYNKSIRHIRGGQATKYKHLKLK